MFVNESISVVVVAACFYDVEVKIILVEATNKYTHKVIDSMRIVSEEERMK